MIKIQLKIDTKNCDKFYRYYGEGTSFCLCVSEIRYFFPNTRGKDEITLTISRKAFAGSKRIFIVKDSYNCIDYYINICRKIKGEYHSVYLIPRQIKFLEFHNLLPKEKPVSYFVSVE